MATKSKRAQTAAQRRARPPTPDRRKLYIGLGSGAVAVVVLALLAAAMLGVFSSGSGSSGPAGQWTVPSQGGSYTNVSADRLAEMLKNKDFTLVNVKTPYIGEIDGTDLYIPYDQLQSRATELPQAKTAKILVYCRSGVESGEAVQTLLSMGYTDIWNLDGGMNAWTATGRPLVQKNRG